MKLWLCSIPCRCLFACKLRRYSRQQCGSTFFTCEAGRRRVLSSAAVTFRINTSQFSYSSSALFILAWIDNRRPLWMNQMNSNSLETHLESNFWSMNCMSSKWETQSCASSSCYWKSSPHLFWILFKKVLELTQLSRKKSCNFSRDMTRSGVFS